LSTRLFGGHWNERPVHRAGAHIVWLCVPITSSGKFPFATHHGLGGEIFLQGDDTEIPDTVRYAFLLTAVINRSDAAEKATFSLQPVNSQTPRQFICVKPTK
jgi:hypothetical protein